MCEPTLKNESRSCSFIQRIAYAKSTSHATVQLHEGPEAVYAIKLGLRELDGTPKTNGSKLTVSGAQKKLIDEKRKEKRARDSDDEEEEDDEDEDDNDARPEKKKGRQDQDDQDDGSCPLSVSLPSLASSALTVVRACFRCDGRGVRRRGSRACAGSAVTRTGRVSTESDVVRRRLAPGSHDRHALCVVPAVSRIPRGG